MSGYDPFTGVFELSASQLERWLQRDLSDIPGKTLLARAAKFLSDEGLDVLFVGKSFVFIRAPQGPIWTALSGHFETSAHQERYTALSYTFFSPL